MLSTEFLLFLLLVLVHIFILDILTFHMLFVLILILIISSVVFLLVIFFILLLLLGLAAISILLLFLIRTTRLLRSTLCSGALLRISISLVKTIIGLIILLLASTSTSRLGTFLPILF